MILEVLMETVIPLMMASIIDNGVEKGDIHRIYVMGGLMIVTACVSLLQVWWGKIRCESLYRFCPQLKKGNVWKYPDILFLQYWQSPAPQNVSTRLTTDVTNIQMAYQMILGMCASGRTDHSGLCHDHGFLSMQNLPVSTICGRGSCGIILAFITVRAHKYFT